MKTRFIILAACSLLPLGISACSTVHHAAHETEEGTEHVAKKTGHAVGHGMEEAGHVVAHGGEELEEHTTGR